MNHLLLILLIVSILFLLRRERNIEGQSTHEQFQSCCYSTGNCSLPVPSIPVVPAIPVVTATQSS